MLNQIVLIGRLGKVEKKENECLATLMIRRPFKNEEGKFDTDFITVSIQDKLADTFQTYAEKGSLVAIKGIIEPIKIEVGKDKYLFQNKIITEKITYL